MPSLLRLPDVCPWVMGRAASLPEPGARVPLSIPRGGVHRVAGEQPWAMSITSRYWASVDLTLKVTRPSLELLVISRALSRGQRLLSYQECTTCCRFSLPYSGAWVKVAIEQGGVRGEGSWPLGWGPSPPPSSTALGG